MMAPLLHLDHGTNVTVEGGGAVDALGELWWAAACGNWWCPPGFTHDSPKAQRHHNDSILFSRSRIASQVPDQA